ncbi:MAG: UDP-N-acetylmuramoyl-tripeptide--D-alanyl-D-alanine ligase [Gemmatimonadales bacterium]|nr:UDP-N-acetylmuramoyl-tripeptide--D-alanyl-D-alanine ligase [Gemmatimonadales bacterium]MDQ3426792.1 UDP-N-acetylmuramoyl-tripeptide--D-alanyl-D-alanine ligase [Gemmatimonadota bacterium]
MILTEAEVRAALELEGPESSRSFSSISTDTRGVARGALFVALSGERFDGHDYLKAAADSGAAGAVVREGTPAVDGLILYPVPDTLSAFGRLARARRRRLAGPVVAITGTNGKTSTKEMLAAVLGTRYRTHATRANLNNLVGVPTTILEAPADTEALVVEAGANLPGEIARYREIIEPGIVVVTNAVAGHLEGFGSLAGVVDEKLSLTDGVELAVVGIEPAALAEGARRRARRVRTAALRGADLTPDQVELTADARARVGIGGTSFTLAARGLHQADNAVRVWAVVEALDLDREAAARALEGFTLPSGRGELIEAGGLTILNDCYNANPQSFRAAIATAAQLRGDRRLVFLAGTMRELGSATAALHAEVARALVQLEPDLLGAVGEFVPALAPYAARLGERLVTASDPLALGPLVAGRLRGDEVVVLKASRGVALERILPALMPRANVDAPGAALPPN